MESAPQTGNGFDQTVKQDFPRIVKPDDWDCNLDELKIDLKNKEQKLNLKEVTDEYELFWELENHKVCYLILKFLEEMVILGNITHADAPLTKTSKEYTDFLKTESVKYTLKDQKLFNYMYKQFDEIYYSTNINSTTKWIKSIDEPDIKIYYRYETEGDLNGSCSFFIDTVI